MKKLLLTTVAVICAGSVFAQGTINFDNNKASQVITRVYIGGSSQVVGDGSGDFPAGTQDWTGFTALTGSGFRVAILGANGAGVAESSLSFGATPTVNSFRSGGNAGRFAQVTATVNSVPLDANNATIELFAWDARTGVTDPVTALADWRAGTIAGGLSGAFNLAAIGGVVNTPPAMVGLQSFNIYTVPEPSTMALAGLGAAALLIFRRRK